MSCQNSGFRVFFFNLATRRDFEDSGVKNAPLLGSANTSSLATIIAPPRSQGSWPRLSRNVFFSRLVDPTFDGPRYVQTWPPEHTLEFDASNPILAASNLRALKFSKGTLYEGNIYSKYNIYTYICLYIYISVPSKGCQIVPKGCQFTIP